MKKLEDIFEKSLWFYRFIILLGIIGLLITSLVIFLYDLTGAIKIVILYFQNLFKINDDIKDFNLIIHVVNIIDHFLLGTVLLIFGLGTYDLFISRIDIAHQQKNVRPHWLVFNSLDELKAILGKVVIMILIVTLLECVIQMKQSIIHTIDFLYLGGAIALVGLSLYLSHSKDSHK